NQDFRLAALSLGILLLAFSIWNLSLTRAASRSLLQGHAMWHLLCALSAYYLFRYYESERCEANCAPAASKTQRQRAPGDLSGLTTLG
ncbi:MAG TPA: hypothetical protein VHI52_13660, partial [Verrucomicrobiae bacterium]|nr:hypothetical protein [Verrucomicrobiae bacterium]